MVSGHFQQKGSLASLSPQLHLLSAASDFRVWSLDSGCMLGRLSGPQPSGLRTAYPFSNSCAATGLGHLLLIRRVLQVSAKPSLFRQPAAVNRAPVEATHQTLCWQIDHLGLSHGMECVCVCGVRELICSNLGVDKISLEPKFNPICIFMHHIKLQTLKNNPFFP